MKNRTRAELVAELERINGILAQPYISLKLRRDFTKYKKRMEKDLKEYDGTIYVEHTGQQKYV